ncbi:CLUMA_CG008550, isoform A [Clunio marinus]|uniref:CLUMA_CG008550, isoform A n=1 Tax=Clunio marinus TaxID=568069 RepID=A0A1J1I437_9DIPT|nr:CLUMA_CG008550, isoform A [Clunio marinus]
MKKSTMSANQMPSFEDDEPPPEAPREGWILVRIHVPELDIYKCLQFPVDKLLWDVKQQVLASLPKELKESFNYGLFCPPSNGKAGKFLDEERRLGDYPFNGPVGYLELKYKRRVYKMLNLDERQLRALHSRSNLRRFLECVNGGHVEKISKMCAKGLDPNFHCQETGETPLTLATNAKKPQKLLIALVNGGALLDYRTKDGSTALHRAVEKDCFEAVSTLLELGASPNYRDARNITPVYLSVTKKNDPKVTEALLHDHAVLGTQDTQGWNEVHQACRNGLAHHLEHLLVYGADMDSKNASGNTPLHVCAVNNQEACARMLLFRGANRGALNYANQTPYQVAVIASNFELAEMIQNYKSDDIVPIRGPPRYNPRRRSGLGCWLNYQHSNSSECAGPTSSIASSNSSWTNSHYHTFARLMNNGGPPSPCPSDHPFNSASSSLSESSSSHRSQEDDISIVTDKSLGDTSDIISDSSGVGTNSESATCSIGHPNTTVVCIEKYESKVNGHLAIQPGDVIEVVGSTDCGLLEGYIRGTTKIGFFPSRYAQEVQFRQKTITNVSTASTNQPNSNTINNNHQSTIVTTNGNEFEQQQQPPPMQQYNSSTAPRAKKNFLMPEPRTVLLHRAKRGFGFVLRGAKAASPLMQLKPSPRCPALQYLDDVDPGGVADMAGLKPGDFLLAINGEDVTCASHEHVVDIIRNSSNVVTMTVLTLPTNDNLVNNINNNYSAINNSRQCSTLPRRMSGPGKLPAPAPPRRDPKTTLSVGRARAKSMVAGLEGDDDEEIPTKTGSIESIHQQTQSAVSTPTQGTPIQPRTASIKSRPTSSRITAAELEDLFQRQQGIENNRYSSMMTTSRFQSSGDNTLTPQTSPAKGPLVYASIADMKRKKTKNGTLRGRPVAIPAIGSDLKRNFHSSPDLANTMSGSATWSSGMFAQKGHLSQEDMHNINASIQRLNLPPPNHPPPPPPVGQVVKVDVKRKSEYESTVALQNQIQQKMTSQQTEIVSSFKPASNAKMYASPQDLGITPSMAFRPSASNNVVTANGGQKSTSTTIINGNNEQNITKVNVAAVSGNLNPYAQPGRAGVDPTNNNQDPNQIPAPPIPEPDYSMSESEEEADNSVRLASSMPTSEGDNSSSGVSSDQEVMMNNSGESKASKASPLIINNTNHNKNQQNKMILKVEETKKVTIISTEDARSDEDSPSPPLGGFQRNNSLTRKQAAMIAANRARALAQAQGHAVSLTQLPPPIEADSDDEVDASSMPSYIVAPPPPEFSDIVSNTRSLHIPTQQSQMMRQHPPSHYMMQQQQMQYHLIHQSQQQQQQRGVRIVGALPKQNAQPQPQKMGHHHIHHYHSHSHHQHH